MINVDSVLYKGRPDMKMSPVEEAIYDKLDSLSIEYFRSSHDAADTIEDCKQVENVLGCEICKNLVLCNQQKTKFYLLLMPGDKKFLTKVLSKEIGSSRLSFAPAEYLKNYLNVTPGSVSILELIFDKDKNVNILIDSDLLKQEYIGCHPGKNTATLKIKSSDIFETFLKGIGRYYTTVDL